MFKLFSVDDLPSPYLYKAFVDLTFPPHRLELIATASQLNHQVSSSHPEASLICESVTLDIEFIADSRSLDFHHDRDTHSPSPGPPP
jgi:hypothetical protein